MQHLKDECNLRNCIFKHFDRFIKTEWDKEGDRCFVKTTAVLPLLKCSPLGCVTWQLFSSRG